MVACRQGFREIAVQCDGHQAAVWYSTEVAVKPTAVASCVFVRERGVQTSDSNGGDSPSGTLVPDTSELHKPILPRVRYVNSKAGSGELAWSGTSTMSMATGDASWSARSARTRGRFASDLTSERVASCSARGRFYTDPTEDQRKRAFNTEDGEPDMWTLRLCELTNDANLKAQNLEGRLKELNALASDALSSSRKARWNLSFCEISTIESQLGIPRRRTSSQMVQHASSGKSTKGQKKVRNLTSLSGQLDSADALAGLSDSQRWPPMDVPPVPGRRVGCYASPVSTCFGNVLPR